MTTVLRVTLSVTVTERSAAIFKVSRVGLSGAAQPEYSQHEKIRYLFPIPHLHTERVHSL